MRFLRLFIMEALSMNTKKISFFHLFLFSFWALVLGFNASLAIIMPKSYQALLLLPINDTLTHGKCINLSLEVPRGFRSLPQPENATMYEFIPETDKDANVWSQIIVPQAFVGRGITAQYQTKLVKAGLMQRSDTNGKVLFESAHDCGTYTTATLIISYTNPLQNRREVTLARYYSGPYDCSGFQYTIALSAQRSEEDAVEKLKEFANKKTSLVKF